MGNTPANLSTPESRQPMFGATSPAVLSRVSGRRDHGGVRILVTGHRGHVGAPVAGFLKKRGHEVAGFDRVEGKDLLDLAAVRGAAAGCEAIVHLAALAHDTAGSPEQIMAVNVLGTWHVLLCRRSADSPHPRSLNLLSECLGVSSLTSAG